MDVRFVDLEEIITFWHAVSEIMFRTLKHGCQV